MLYEKLKEYAASGVYPMHMPGHKRNGDFMPPGFPCDIDITEIHGFDDLHDPKEVLLESNKLAADLYGSTEAFILVNGTTVGILAAIGAHTERGDKILAVSGCHWSTTNAAKLFGLDIVYITPEVDEMSGVACSVRPESIKSVLDKNPDIKTVIITSPTYEGVVSDAASIAEIVHYAGGILIVDGAHGAHLGFSDSFPENATRLGADIVIVSLHKTLPALTQCSLLHVCSERVDTANLKELLSILQTSSPSYVLMASIDYCLRLLEADGEKLFKVYEQNLKEFDIKIKSLKNLPVLCHGQDSSASGHHPGFFDFDPGKIVVITKSTVINGAKLADILRTDHKIEIERVYSNYIIAMTSICDTSEGFTRLADALCSIDQNITDNTLFYNRS